MFSREHEDFDEFCDPENPKALTFGDIENAASRIEPFIRKTPVLPSKNQREFRINLHYKLDFLQPSGSFKDRGTLNFFHQLSLDRHKVGVITSDTGNFAISLCHYAALMKIPITVVMPKNAPREKVYKCEHMGAKVLLEGLNVMEAQKYARALARETDITYVNSRDHPYVLAGYGTLGIEIVKQLPAVDAILVPVGSGGLISAVATAVKHLKPECKVYGVEPEATPTVFKSLETGEPVVLPEGRTRADNVSVPHPGCNSFHMNRTLLDKMLLVKEDWISHAVTHLFDFEKYVVEGAGACALAAVFGKLVPEFKKKTIVCLLTGGNIEMIVLAAALEHCLGSTGRLIKFQVKIRNTTGGLNKLINIIAKLDCNIRHWVKLPTYDEDHLHYVMVKMFVETPNMHCYLDLKRILTIIYPESCRFELDNVTQRRECPCSIKRQMNKKTRDICCNGLLQAIFDFKVTNIFVPRLYLVDIAGPSLNDYISK